ncbi:MAG: hypothetical protein ACUVQK_15805, partial [Thermogutta sp.]
MPTRRRASDSTSPWSALAGAGTALGVIGTVLGAILSPVGLVIAALASLGGYLLYVSSAGQQAL